MDATTLETRRDFVTRQYATLLAGGIDATSARARLQDVLGEAALELIDVRSTHAGSGNTDDQDISARLADAAQALGGTAANTQVAWIHAAAEARLFALDWWRPIRTFLLYILFLLAFAVVIAVIYAVFVLPAFGRLDATMGMAGGGAAAWIMREGALRLFAPLLLMALLLVLLATMWRRMQRAMARLQPMRSSRLARLHGGSGDAYRALLCLEYASILKAGGVADAAVLDPAMQLADWPAGTPFARDGENLGEQLRQAERLGTFDAELDWQRRLAWSRAQSQLEMARDRLILGARVLFYILIGIMVGVLYVPIFTVANLFGVQ